MSTTEVTIEPTKDEKLYGSLAHFLTFAGYVFPFGNIIAPLVIFLMKKDESAYIRRHGAEALNFQISIMIYMIVSAVLALVVVGIFLLFALIIMDLVCTIIAGVRANDGKSYHYPLTIRFIS